MALDFAGFRLDVQRRLLLRLPSLEQIPLTGKAIDILVVLVEARGAIVPKATLMQAVWGRVVVEENNLERHVSMLRKALGERPGDNRFIATIAGQGYRFVAVVTSSDDGPTTSPNHVAPDALAPQREIVAARPRVPWPLAVGVGIVLAGVGIIWRTWTTREGDIAKVVPAASIPAQESLAVMPFTNLTGDSSREYIGDGLAEELIHRLTHGSQLRVPARTSSFAYKGRNVDVRQIGQDLGVSYLLEGSVRGSTDQLRVTVQLIDVRTGLHVWSQQYERRGDDIFALQGELAAAVLQRLAPGIQASGTTGVEAGPPTRNVAAYRAFLEANALGAPGEPALSQSIALYDEAIEADPGFARALAARAGARMAQLMLGSANLDAYAQAQRDARRALQLEPSLGAAHAVLALGEMWRGNWSEGLHDMERARALEPRDPNLMATHAIMLASVGRLDEALAAAESGAAQAPLSMPALLPLAYLKNMNGQDTEALQLVQRVIGLGASPAVGLASVTLTELAARSGRVEEAAARVVASMPAAARATNAEAVLLAVYQAHRDASLRPAAARMLREFVASVPVDSLDRRRGTLLITLHVLVGDLDSAYGAAHAVLDRYGEAGLIGYPWMTLWSADMAEFRADPRFTAFVRRLKLPLYWKAAGPPQSCIANEQRIECGRHHETAQLAGL